jgi:hypothetical protein
MTVWNETKTDDIHRPMFTNDQGWTLNFWRGIDPRWMIHRPDGTLWWWNPTLTADKVAEAQTWASEAIDRIAT